MTDAESDALLTGMRVTLNEPSSHTVKLLAVCEFLKAEVSYYNWVGFYLVDKANRNMLVLGPYVGEPTDHIRIPIGQGICGQALARRHTFVVQDVSKEENYLACDIRVRSEIVVPIFRAGVKPLEVFGELDIDSYSLAPFSNADEIFLETLCVMIAEVW